MKQKTVPELLSEDSVGFANSIYIINIGGYIGQNPRSEIEYAKKHSKEISYLGNK